MMNESTVRIGYECQVARQLHGLTIRDMEKLTGYNKSRLSRFENGKYDDDIFLMYEPFWTPMNECIVFNEDPRQVIKPIEDIDDFLATAPQYCIYDPQKEARYMQLTDRNCNIMYWKVKEFIEHMTKRFQENDYTQLDEF